MTGRCFGIEVSENAFTILQVVLLAWNWYWSGKPSFLLLFWCFDSLEQTTSLRSYQRQTCWWYPSLFPTPQSKPWISQYVSSILHGVASFPNRPTILCYRCFGLCRYAIFKIQLDLDFNTRIPSVVSIPNSLTNFPRTYAIKSSIFGLFKRLVCSPR